MSETDDFIRRWAASGASERANYQIFLSELCQLLGVEAPHPSQPDEEANAYVFEKRVNFVNADGSTTVGRMDLYKRGCFVVEAKQGAEQGAARMGHGRRGSGQWDHAMVRAKRQAEAYIHALPVSEGRPPFVLAVDVGHSIEVYSEFSCTGGIYVPFPDPRSHRMQLADLAKPELRTRLARIWTDPHGLDPSKLAARVTREIAGQLARLAQSMEGSGHAPPMVAGFLMRCLFTMFAEDIGLLPQNGFCQMLESFRGRDLGGLVPTLESIWQTMDKGGYAVALQETVLRFNGGLFEDCRALPLNREQLDLLIAAAKSDWREVEPAIFGTLLERSLDPQERHKFGAHFTPRAYVERLVIPTVIAPLRADWEAAQAAATALLRQNKERAAMEEVARFHRQLCHVQVLDPACGSGNFLYVTLEHLKRLEGEVIDTLTRMGDTQAVLELAGETVHPSQFLGIELNPRAAVLAELCLWIGYLQWHFRTRGDINPPEPVISKFHTVECRDAILASDEAELRIDADGQCVTQWDGITFKPHASTGEAIPDEAARKPVYDYPNPRPADWPTADFVVGNPPFIGPARMRAALGDGYVEALRATLPDVPESADLVMYWWDKAAALARAGAIRRFGFITTNSLRQTFARRVLERHLIAQPPLRLTFAIPDHPWVDSADGAAVRIAMTVAARPASKPGDKSGATSVAASTAEGTASGEPEGELACVVAEREAADGTVAVDLATRTGIIHANLTIGTDVGKAVSLRANAGLSNRGVQIIGSGFITTREEAAQLGLGRIQGLEQHIREYRNGKDLTQRSRDVMVIDLFGLTATEVRDRFPDVYQWVADHVKPERDQNKRDSYRINWWIHGEPRKAFRPALVGLPRYIATVETAKHRVFQFLDASILPDNRLVCFALADAFSLGILSSRIHVIWTLATGGVLEDRPVYNKTVCFETYAFPEATAAQRQRIGELAEKLDALRKERLAAAPQLTLTGIYNVLEAVRNGATLSAKERAIYDAGLVGVLRELHDELDAAVADAYGWPTDLPTDSVLERLLELNRQRAVLEAAGQVQWLRPDYQNAAATADPSAEQAEIDGMESQQGSVSTASATSASAIAPADKLPWPAQLAAQAALVRKVARESGWNSALPLDPLAARFRGVRKVALQDVVDALVELGQLG